MKSVITLLLLLPNLTLADTQPRTEHQIVVSEGDMAAGAEVLNERFEKAEVADRTALLFMSNSEARVWMVSNAVEYVSEDKKMTIHFRIGSDSLETAESDCRTVLGAMAQIVPDVIGTNFVWGDTHSHSVEELQRFVLHQTDMLCTVGGPIGVAGKTTVRYSFGDGSYLVSETPDTDE